MYPLIILLYNSCRRIDSSLNIFSNIHRNQFFIFVFFLCVCLQAIIVNFGGVAFQVTPIDGPSWALSIVVGLFAIPVGAVIRLIPDKVFGFLFFKPATRQRYLGENYVPASPVNPSIYLAGNDTYDRVQDGVMEFKKGTRRESATASIVIPSIVAAAPSTGAAVITSPPPAATKEHHSPN